jgi:hypothetical protein
MKARLLKKWGGFYAGQVLTNVDKSSIPAGVAEFFEDDDPAVMTVVDKRNESDPLTVINDEINPAHAKAHNESQRAIAKESDASSQDVSGAVEEMENERAQKQARHADKVAAGRDKAKAGGKSALSEGQKKNNAAGKSPVK